MLVLSRKTGETMHFRDAIRITVTTIQCNRVRLAIDAPGDVAIWRGELGAAQWQQTLSPPAVRKRPAV